MLGERLQHRKNAAAGPEPDPRSRPGAGEGSQSLVVSGKEFRRDSAVASRQGIERGVEFGVKFEPAGDPAKADDLGPYR
jgi:hypothetical protein